MRLLLVSYYYGLTASGVISQRVTEELSRRGHEIIVVCNEVNPLLENKSGVHIISIPVFASSSNLITRIFYRLKRENGFYLYNKIWVRKATSRSRQIVREFKPDVVYCRTSPEDACYVGYNLQKALSIPVLQHFSDPIPAPLEYLPLSRKRRKVISHIRKVLKEATLISYGNAHMQRYVEKELGIELKSKAFVSPDMASSGQLFFSKKNNNSNIIITYLGNIYGGRNPKPLFDAIEKLNSAGCSLELRLYSNITPSLLTAYSFIKGMGYTNNIREALAEADILVDLDGDDKEPVFISSKLKDYLLINRPILSITPEKSPSSDVLTGLKTVLISRNNSQQISAGIGKLINNSYCDNDYMEREGLIKYFSPQTVALEIENKMTVLCERDLK